VFWVVGVRDAHDLAGQAHDLSGQNVDNPRQNTEASSSPHHVAHTIHKLGPTHSHPTPRTQSAERIALARPQPLALLVALLLTPHTMAAALTTLRPIANVVKGQTMREGAGVMITRTVRAHLLTAAIEAPV
jgi:hypothetical protein